MSGQLPTTPEAKSAKINSQQHTLISTTTSGRVQTRQIDGQKFAITLDYPPMNRATFAPVKAFLMKQRARLNTFTVIPPIVSDAQGSATGTKIIREFSWLYRFRNLKRVALWKYDYKYVVLITRKGS